MQLYADEGDTPRTVPQRELAAIPITVGLELELELTAYPFRGCLVIGRGR